jgi:hypothetical protein
MFIKIKKDNKLHKPSLGKRLSLLALVGIILLPLLSGGIVSADPHATASALAPSYSPQDEARSLTYYNVLGQCIAQNMKGDIQLTGAQDGNATPDSWFDGLTAEGTVFPDGKQDCKDITPKALQLWGYTGSTNNKDFLNALGYTYNAGSAQWHGTADSSTRLKQFQNAVGLRVYNSITNSPSVSDAAKYELYMHAFTGSDCKAKDLGIYPTSNSTYNDWALNSHVEDGQNTQVGIGGVSSGSIKYGRVDIVAPSGDKKETHVFAWYSASTYSGDGISSTDLVSSLLYGYRESTDTGGVRQNCDDLAHSLIPGTMGGWIDWKLAHPNTTTTQPPATAANSDVKTNDPTSNCKVEGVGWIICPVVNVMAGIVDSAYAFIGGLLIVQPLLTTGNTAGIYSAWSIMRNFANVAFVIAFLIIIFSQLSSLGLNNYGIKKMLPRLIIAAILVNVSYWLCSIAVDISNILGGSLNGMFKGIGAGIPDGPNTTVIATGSGWVGIASLVLAGSAALGIALYVGLAALIPALIAALLAVVTVFLVLTLRQALIILLIVVSPLAFVAFLLPNTESLFKKWRELLQTLLLMYPIIAFIFGASALASTIVMKSAQGQNYAVAVEIMGALIAVLPLAITPLVMKSAGGLLNRFGGMVNNPSKGPFDRMRKSAEGYRKNRQEYRGLKAMKGVRSLPGMGWNARRGTRRSAVLASREAGLKDAKTNYIAGTAAANDGENVFAKQMAGGGRFISADEGAKNAVVASALSQQKKAFADDVSNMEALVKIRFKDDPGAALKQAIEKGDNVQAVAAQNLLFKSGGGGVSKFRDIIEESEANNEAGNINQLAAVTDKIRSNITENHGQYAKQKGADIVSWASGAKDENGNLVSLTSATAGALSDNDLAGQHSGSIQKLVIQGKIDKVQADRMLHDPRVSANLDDKQKAALQDAIRTGPGTLPPQESQATPPQASQAPAAGSPVDSRYAQRDSGLFVPRDHE